jgi:hypothetical protein
MARRDIPEHRPEQREGFITGEGDAGFHADILGEDRLPPEVLEKLRQRARDLGLDPDMIVR